MARRRGADLLRRVARMLAARLFVVCLLRVLLLPSPTYGQWFVSANDAKIDLTSGKPRWIAGAGRGSVSIIHFAQFPPTVRHWRDQDNTVIGPPSNVAITRDGRRVLLANSIREAPEAKPDPWLPHTELLWLDVESNPPRILSRLTVPAQPSGLSLSSDEHWAVVACRAAGKVVRVSWPEDQLKLDSEADVCGPSDQLADVSIEPHDQFAIASIQKGGYLRLVRIEGEQLVATDTKMSVAGQPYRVVITPDGQLAVTAGQGMAMNGVDQDAVTVVDLTCDPPAAVDLIPVGTIPESLEISPNGRWLAVVLMNGSHFPPEDRRHRESGELVILRRDGKTFRVFQKMLSGRIPEGVAFTPDSQHLLVQCYPDRLIWILKFDGERFADSSYRIDVPGMPAALRASR